MLDSREQLPKRALLRAHEAAYYLGVTPAQLRNSRHTGELFRGVDTPPFLKVGRSVMYRQSTLDDVLMPQSQGVETPRVDNDTLSHPVVPWPKK